MAVGGDLSPERLVAAYRKGIFPWYSEGEPILWWSPDPRMVLFPDEMHVSKSLKKVIRKGTFRISFDEDFGAVIRSCSELVRRDQLGTWIVPEMIEAYEKLHAAGVAHSVEAWQGDTLVGGLYGLSIGRVFFGESMFSSVSEASKVALASLVNYLKLYGFRVIDCQQKTGLLRNFGAREVHRDEFVDRIEEACEEAPDKMVWKS